MITDTVIKLFSSCLAPLEQGEKGNDEKRCKTKFR